MMIHSCASVQYPDELLADARPADPRLWIVDPSLLQQHRDGPR